MRCDMLPDGNENSYHIATEQRGVISHLRETKIYRTSVSEYIAKNYRLNYSVIQAVIEIN